MIAARPSELRPRPNPEEVWVARAFGLDVELGFAAPGLPRMEGNGRPADPTGVRLVYASSIDANWPEHGARRVGTMGPSERPVMEVDEHLSAGYRIVLRPYGRYLVSADGRDVACAPPAVAWWYWQRLLIGQVLPAAAALRGFELLHASAVTIADRAIAFAGPPGLGKSSLALRLMLRGRPLLAEDVLALEVRDERVMAEPGACMLNVREAEFQRLDARERGLLGETVGHSQDKRHVIAPREDRSLPLGVVYLLERGGASDPVFEPLRDVRAADLYANSFVTYVHRTGRMIRQLDLASVLARTVPVVRLRVQPGVSAAELAARVEEHTELLL